MKKRMSKAQAKLETLLAERDAAVACAKDRLDRIYALEKTVRDLRGDVAFYEAMHLRQRELLVALGRIKNWAHCLAHKMIVVKDSRSSRSVFRDRTWLWSRDVENLVDLSGIVERLVADYETLLAGIKAKEAPKAAPRSTGPFC
jgi:hypothetical protein